MSYSYKDVVHPTHNQNTWGYIVNDDGVVLFDDEICDDKIANEEKNGLKSGNNLVKAKISTVPPTAGEIENGEQYRSHFDLRIVVPSLAPWPCSDHCEVPVIWVEFSSATHTVSMLLIKPSLRSPRF